MMFSRENGVVTLGPILQKQNVSTQANAQLPYLAFLEITYDLSEIKEAVEWFRNVEIANFANHHTDERIIVLGAETKAKNLFLTMLNNMGISIEDFRVEQDAESARIKDLYVARTVDGKRYELPIGSESDGTRKLFGLIPLIIRVLSMGAVLIVDELDAKLHPMLIRYLIQLFKSPDINPNGAQLLFTSHDLSTMTGELFRRDEIWFACRNNEEASELYSLYEIRDEENHRVRANAAFDKQYLEGRYGADPYLKRMLSWEA
jgi:AAA15 family ATPase/GTPase